MHGGLCDCCRCDKAENRRLRLIDEMVDALPDAISDALDGLLSEVIGNAADAVGYDGDEDFTAAALRTLIDAAAARYRALATSTYWNPAMAAAELARIVRPEAA